MQWKICNHINGIKKKVQPTGFSAKGTISKMGSSKKWKIEKADCENRNKDHLQKNLIKILNNYLEHFRTFKLANWIFKKHSIILKHTQWQNWSITMKYNNTISISYVHILATCYTDNKCALLQFWTPYKIVERWLPYSTCLLSTFSITVYSMIILSWSCGAERFHTH